MRHKTSVRIARSISVSSRNTSQKLIRDYNGKYLSYSGFNTIELNELRRGASEQFYIFNIVEFSGVEKDKDSMLYGKPVTAVAFKTVFEKTLYLAHVLDGMVELIKGKINERNNHIVIETDTHNLFHCIRKDDYVIFEVADPLYPDQYLASNSTTLFVKTTEDIYNVDEIKFYLEDLAEQQEQQGCFTWFKNLLKPCF